MHEADRIEVEACGCHYDVVTGVRTFTCIGHSEVWDWAIVDDEGNVYELVKGGPSIADGVKAAMSEKVGKPLHTRPGQPGDFERFIDGRSDGRLP